MLVNLALSLESDQFASLRKRRSEVDTVRIARRWDRKQTQIFDGGLVHETCRKRFSIDLVNSDSSPLVVPGLVLNQVLHRQHVRTLTCVLDDRSGAPSDLGILLVADPDGETKEARMYFCCGLYRRAVRAASLLRAGRTTR